MGCSNLNSSYANGYVEEKLTISVQRYNALVAREEQLRIIKELVRGEREGFGDYKILRSILGIATVEAPVERNGRNLDE